MPDILCTALPTLSRPLLDKFYRSHRSPMRMPAHSQAWVARNPDIVAALCLTPVQHGHWLTGLFVAPALRGRRLAARLIDQARTAHPGPLWLFCHPQLLAFYQPLGFTLSEQLPPPLDERLARYRRSKPLLALRRD